MTTMASPPSVVQSGPWRATRLWNDLVRSFVSGMPVRRHLVKKSLTTHHECFSGSEAVSWMTKYLRKNPNFGPDVSKEQAVRLLHKLLLAGIMVAVDQARAASSEDITEDADFSQAALYRFAPNATAGLRTPGKKDSSEAKRRPLTNLENTPSRRKAGVVSEDEEQIRPKKTGLVPLPSSSWDTKSEFSGLRKSLRRVKQKKSYKVAQPQDETTFSAADKDITCSSSEITLELKQDLNRTYFQSLPANSLILLDNDSTWKTAFCNQLGSVLSAIHVKGLEPHMQINYIIYNMTKVSPKGIVQLSSDSSAMDLPHWVLSAMKCLANWPRPLRMLDGQESELPSYPGFMRDVFAVVRDFFVGHNSPLVPFALYDAFQSALVKAEAIGAKMKCVPRPSIGAHRMITRSYEFLDGMSQVQTSTPTLSQQNQHFYEMSKPSSDYPTYEAIARVRQTLEVTPQVKQLSALSVDEPSTSIGSYGFTEDLYSKVTPRPQFQDPNYHKSLLPPNTCFETAFMHEAPITRIVPQKENDTLHLHTQNRAAAVYTPIPSGGSVTNWDTRSIATQTSVDEEKETETKERKKLPKWKRAARQRKSIAVMETSSEKENNSPRGMANPAFQMSPLSNHIHAHPVTSSRRSLAPSSTDAEDDGFLERYQRLSLAAPKAPKAATTSSDCMIPSKTVRKEKRRQRQRRARSVEPILDGHVSSYSRVNYGFNWDSPNSSNSTTSTWAEIRQQPGQRPQQYLTATYNDLTVKTPIDVLPTQGMQLYRAEPYRHESSCEEDLHLLSQEGVTCAIESFRLLGLLLPPSNRRKLQLLLKFIRRVSANPEITLDPTRGKTNENLLLDTFSDSILRPKDMAASYDNELARKLVRFFVEHFDTVWTPPEALRREVEEQVYQSLVSKRLEAGEDPYPITYCERVSSKVYETERASGAQSALFDLLDHLLTSNKFSVKEKRKKIAKFKESYPMIYRQKFPSTECEPEWLRRATSNSAGSDQTATSSSGKFASLSRLKHAIRL